MKFSGLNDYVGNINLNKRKVIADKNGGFVTEKPTVVKDNDKWVILPTVIYGSEAGRDKAKEHYSNTNEHLGKFDTKQGAYNMMSKINKRQEKYYIPDSDRFMLGISKSNKKNSGLGV